jgi:hypothetical protein
MKLDFTSVVGSDCHSFQGNNVPGSRYTWIKMETPSLQGLRLALLDGQEVSVRRSDEGENFSPFSTPEFFIKSIEICKTQCMGLGKQPALLRMSPYFNAVVGGRGTGKSTIVHALRLALRRNSELPPESEARRIFDNFVDPPRGQKGGLHAIVTHNPNIVVNGDAELIHVLDFNHQCFVKQTGSLQDLAMRQEVCQVMEGGKVAFERRYQRLGKEV